MLGTIVTIDSNENSHHPEHIIKFAMASALCNIKPLAFDFEIIVPSGELLAVERKTPRDLLDSIKDRRLFNQCNDMVAKTKWSYLVVCGTFTIASDGQHVMADDDYTFWDWASLQGALLSIQEMGVSIIYDPDFYHAVAMLVSRSRNDIKVAPRREAYVFNPTETVLMTLPGIGSKRATEMSRMFPSPGAALEYLTHPHSYQLDEVPVGRATREKIRSFIGGGLQLDLGDDK